MNDWPEDPLAEPLDDIARLLDQLEAIEETRIALGDIPLEEIGFRNTGAAPTASRAQAAPDSDRYLDPLARQLGALEDYQESLVLPPPPKFEAPKPYKPESQAYGSFPTKPPVTLDEGFSGAGRNWAGPRIGPHPVGRSAGVRASFGHDSHSGGTQSEFWCLRLGEAVTGPHAGCEACQRGCPFAESTEDEDDEEEQANSRGVPME
ncbi:MAG: hypothetical protein FJ291_00115 [Planctomycetes bacterium]|nr:hypothetical protein [Planctomycetota bacterium]